jgi:hypothetical protein
MNSELNKPFYTVYCNRDIIFKKYNRQISELVRLDFNIDILPKNKGMYYTDGNGNKSVEILYIDMSSKTFVVYNEDLKKCGHYDYDDEQINYHKLPIPRTPDIKTREKVEKKSKQTIVVDEDDEEDVLLKIAISESLKYVERERENDNRPNNNDNKNSLSGIKAEERLQRAHVKHKPNSKFTNNNFEFQDEKIRKLWN